MARSTAIASLAIMAAFATSPLAAQAPSTTGTAGQVAPIAGGIVGGGGATLLGGGDDMVVLYSPGGAGGGVDYAQPGRTARFATTDGDGPQVEYPNAAPAGAARGREAWLYGGGDNAEVVYEPRAARRSLGCRGGVAPPPRASGRSRSRPARSLQERGLGGAATKVARNRGGSPLTTCRKRPSSSTALQPSSVAQRRSPSTHQR